MKAVFLKGDPAELRVLARRYAYPYQLYEDDEGALLVVFAAGPDLIEAAEGKGARVRILLEEACARKSTSSR